MARHCFRSVLIKWPCLLRSTLTKEPDVKDNNKTQVNLFNLALKKVKMPLFTEIFDVNTWCFIQLYAVKLHRTRQMWRQLLPNGNGQIFGTT